MKVNNNVNFTGRYFVVGSKNPALKDPEEIINQAVKSSITACNAIKKHCGNNNIQYFCDDFIFVDEVVHAVGMPKIPVPKNVEEIPDQLVMHAILTGDDAKRIKPMTEYTIEDLDIPKENLINASDILKAIGENLFDFVNGVIRNK